MINGLAKVFIILSSLLASFSVWAGSLFCGVDGSDDRFILYLVQRI